MSVFQISRLQQDDRHSLPSRVLLGIVSRAGPVWMVRYRERWIDRQIEIER